MHSSTILAFFSGWSQNNFGYHCLIAYNKHYFACARRAGNSPQNLLFFQLFSTQQANLGVAIGQPSLPSSHLFLRSGITLLVIGWAILFYHTRLGGGALCLLVYPILSLSCIGVRIIAFLRDDRDTVGILDRCCCCWLWAFFVYTWSGQWG